MSTTQQGALELATGNENAAMAWKDGSEPNLFRKNTAAMLRQQHALIVQMAAALEKSSHHMTMHPVVGSGSALLKVSKSLAAAKDYLK